MRSIHCIIGILLLIFVSRSNVAAAQEKKEIVDWLSSHLREIKLTGGDPDLKYTLIKTYFFYEDYFMVETEKSFVDKTLNLPNGFAKVWYKDIVDTCAQGYQQQHPKNILVFNIWANPGFYILGHKEAPLSFWRSFDGASGVPLYLPGDKAISDEIIKKLFKLRALSLP